MSPRRIRLIKNAVGQVLKRMIDLHLNTKQTVIIDIRGQIDVRHPNTTIGAEKCVHKEVN